MATSTTPVTMRGSVLGVILHDVCEEIRLEQLRDILGARRVEPGFKHATPDYVRFENPPVVERLEPVVLTSGEKLIPQIKYYDYGVISVLFELEFEADWETLVQLAAGWVPNPELERQAQQIIHGRLDRIAPALVHLYREWLSEDYYVFTLSGVPAQPLGSDLQRMTSGAGTMQLILETYPGRRTYEYGMTYVRDALSLIPSPIKRNFIAESWWGGFNGFVSYSCGYYKATAQVPVMGEFYANFGMIGVLFGSVCYGMGLQKLSNCLRLRSIGKASLVV